MDLECYRGLEKLNEALVSAPVLGPPNSLLPFVVKTDACDTWLDADKKVIQ